MVRQNLTFITNQNGGIVDASETSSGPLVETDVGEDLALGASLLEGADFRAGDEETGAGEAGEEAVVVYWGGEGGPEGIGWDVCFGEDDEVGSVVSGFADERDGFFDCFGGVEEDWGDVAGWFV